MSTHPLEPIGDLMMLGALIASVALGYLAKPAIASILLASLVFSAGYVIARLPQLIGLCQTERRRILLIPIYLIVGYSILAGIGYGVGWLFS